MKFLVFIFSLTLMVKANAGLISAVANQTTYNNGDTVVVDVFVNDLNPALDFLELDFSFDDSVLSFIDNSWFDSAEVFSYGAFGDAFSLSPNTLILQANFLNGITDIVGTTFKLGELQFLALNSVNTPLFSSTIITAQDINFNNIDAQRAVPAPSGLALLSIAFGCFFLRSSYLSK